MRSYSASISKIDLRAQVLFSSLKSVFVCMLLFHAPDDDMDAVGS